MATSVGEGVSLRWQPYQLYPNIPPQGLDRRAYLRQRYGDQADGGRIPERIAVEAEEEGIELRFDKIKRTPNTLLAHCLLEYSANQDVQHEMAERLFIAYFCEGQDVGDLNTLVELGAEMGLPASQLQAYLFEGNGLEAVQAQLARAPELGISGVPGYVMAGGFLLPGAQSSDTMSQIITRVKDRLVDKGVA